MALKEEEGFSKDHGKFIGEKGFKVLLKSLGISVNEESVKEQFVKWDLDHDGKISEEECVVLFKSVVDNDRLREVVLKFMRNTEHFQREVGFRDDCKFDSKYVVGVTDSFSCDTHDNFASALKSFCKDGGLDLGEYENAIVMPFADRSLDAIFRSERPDKVQIRVFAKQLAEAIKHVHSKGLFHGDVKLQNVVRFGEGLRLIDLDAAAEIDSFADAKNESSAGAKFSSGMLPPEMIANLTVGECECFEAYFKEVNNADTEWSAKIDPKVFGRNEFFVVKTFRSYDLEYSEKERVSRGEYKETQYIKHDHPVDKSKLPYPLVKATEAIDIWSFGVILYTLDTGAPVFDVNRDDDLKTAEAMKELCEWNEDKKKAKLKAVQDPLAYKLLMNILSRNPSDRYQSMQEPLNDEYFMCANYGEYLEKHLHSFDTKLDAILDNTLELPNIKEDILETIRRSTSGVLTAIFDATEVKTPTCFIILPEELPVPGRDSGDETGDVADKAKTAVTYIGDALEMVSSCINKPVDFAAKFVKSKFYDLPMFLYLVDEWTGEPVVCVSSGIYPVKIPAQSHQVEKFLPLMALGIQALARIDDAAKIVKMFYPVVPGISEEFLEKAKQFVEKPHKSGVIEKIMEEDSTARIPVRGNELREFEKFLKEKDAACTFNGLIRVCGKSTGKAMWVTEKSAREMEMENDKSQLEQLQSQITLLTTKNQHLIEQQNTVRHDEPQDVEQLQSQITQSKTANQQQKDAKSKEILRLKSQITQLTTENQQQNNAKCCAIL